MDLLHQRGRSEIHASESRMFCEKKAGFIKENLKQKDVGMYINTKDAEKKYSGSQR